MPRRMRRDMASEPADSPNWSGVCAVAESVGLDAPKSLVGGFSRRERESTTPRASLMARVTARR